MSSKLVRQARRLLLSTVMLSMGLGTLPAQADVSSGQVGALVEALRLAAPQTGIENDGLYSDWQIKPENIPRWSKQCTGRELTPQDFAASPVIARAILVCVMRDVFNEQYGASGNNESVAVRRTASWWMTGDATRYNSTPTNAYTQKVLDFYQQQRRTAQSQPPATSSPRPATQPSAQPPASQRSGQPPARSSSSSGISDAQVGALVEALRLAAPQTGTENDGLYSDWQIKPENIPRWSQQCTGRELTPQEFAASPVSARAILVCVMRDVFGEQYDASGNDESLAVRRTASWWMTGDATRYNSTPTNAYTQKVLDFYQQQRGTARSQPPATSSPRPATQPSAQPAATQPQPTPQPSSQATNRSASPSQISDAQVGALVEAFRLAVSGNDNENDELYSEWQVKAENIPRWSQQCNGREMTPQEFAASPVTARAILVCVMRPILREQYSASDNSEFLAVRRAASWWMTGDPNQYDSGSIAPYTQRVLNMYKRSRLKFFSHI